MKKTNFKTYNMENTLSKSEYLKPHHLNHLNEWNDANKGMKFNQELYVKILENKKNNITKPLNHTKMKELFLPYELAVIAKEKVFNEKCLGYYDTGCQLIIAKSKDHKQYYQQRCLAPLYQQIIDWFRDKHKIHISIRANTNGVEFTSYEFTIFRVHRQTANQFVTIGNGKDYYLLLNKAIEEAFKII